MNHVLKEVKKIIEENRKLYVPNVKNSDLEKDGAVFYMNGRDGTEFDWYVNGKLPPFMVFYNDEKNLGAVKCMLYNDGTAILCIYDDNGENMIKEVQTRIEAREEELFELAVILRTEADDRLLWGEDIESIHTDIEVSEEMRREFLNRESNYDSIKDMRAIFSLKALVSRKVADEGWKVGYMERYKPNNPADSGWAFFAGNEDEKYNLDVKNIVLADVGYVCKYFDGDIFKYVSMPVGTKLIRVSENEFKVDDGRDRIFVVKREK